jgi:hypothetical protein
LLERKQIEKNEMGGTYRTHGGKEKFIKKSGMEASNEEIFGRA